MTDARWLTDVDEAMYRSMVESAPAYFYVASPVDTATIYRSPQAESILGYTSADWAANPDLWSELLHPDDRERVLAAFRECARGGRPFRCEYRLRTRSDGLRWVRDHARLIPDPSGSGQVMQGVVLDITEEKAARDAAADARDESDARSRFMDVVFEHAPLGVAKVGIDMLIADVNPRLRSMLWSGDGDMVGRHFGEFLPADEVERVIQVFRPLWKGEVERIESDSHAIRRDGTRLWLHWTATTVRDGDRRIAYFLVLFEDITAKHEAEERAAAALVELDRLNHLKSEFISVVSHEFRTALTGIQGFSELLRDQEMSAAEVKELAADINSDALRLNRLITEMLDLDRMEAGRLMMRTVPTDLNRLLVEAAERSQVANPARRVGTDLQPGLPPVSVDPDRIVQVVSNLLSNAVKYSAPGSPIEVSSRLAAGEVTIGVRDHGRGIPADFLPKLFQRYERYESEASQRVMGTGLGLPISRQIVEMHGGRIWAESTEGVGSLFQFTLPLEPSGQVK